MNRNHETLTRDLQDLGIWPESADAVRAALFETVVRETDLTATDFQTIRDVCEIGGIPAGEARTALEAAMMNLFLVRVEGGLSMTLDPARPFDRLPAFEGRDILFDILLKNLKKKTYASIVGDAAPTPFLPLIRDERRLAFHRYREADDRLQSALRERQSAPDTPETGLPASPEAWRDIFLTVTEHSAVTLGDDQKTALAAALIRRFFVITGGPGTGKTSVVFTLIRCLLQAGLKADRIALAAPTGRAAQRLGETLRIQLGLLREKKRHLPGDEMIECLEPRTLHRLLGYSPSKLTFSHSSENPLEADLILVDETSMVDTELMSRLLDAAPPEARIILIGDRDQLPSVEAGTVLADLVGDVRQSTFSHFMAMNINKILGLAPTAEAGFLTSGKTSGQSPMADRIAVLQTCHRANTTIIEAARAINGYCPGGDFTAHLRGIFPPGRENILEWRSPAEWTSDGFSKEIAAWSAEFAKGSGNAFSDVIRSCLKEGIPMTGESLKPEHPLTGAFEFLTRRKILTVYREGPFGVESINRLVSAQLRKQLPGEGWGAFFPGAVVMVTRNDYRLELFNGDTGLVLPAKDGGLFGVFPRPGTILRVPVDELPGPEPAFAVTVHKSQGSEYDEVFLILPLPPSDTAARLLSREIVYTGLTRAKHRVTLLADPETLHNACSRRATGPAVVSDVPSPGPKVDS
ncbi:MAG TPA: exodeoxyribonuclease V subunit alpha [Candidatus Ozemobacteraceae bacterium]|nr:exodeoxyribonuclease V subunit alpha [Candidatus Ozemobacteraceae bacterium]